KSLFEAGGTSAQALRVLGALRKELHIDVSVNQFFRDSRPEIIAQLPALRGHPAAVRPPVASHAPSHPLTYGQYWLWLQHEFSEDKWAFNMPFAVCISGELDVDALARA